MTWLFKGLTSFADDYAPAGLGNSKDYHPLLMITPLQGWWLTPNIKLCFFKGLSSFVDDYALAGLGNSKDYHPLLVMTPLQGWVIQRTAILCW